MFNNQIEEQLLSARSEILSGNHRKYLKISYFFYCILVDKKRSQLIRSAPLRAVRPSGNIYFSILSFV